MSDIDDDTVEGDWKYMGGLDPQDARMMRRVMATLFSVSSRDEVQPTDHKYDAKKLTKKQRARIRTMIYEAGKENPLLSSMLDWLATKHNLSKDRRIVDAVLVICKRVTIAVREPRMYTEDYKVAVKEWVEFLELNDETLNGHIYPDFAQMLKTIDLDERRRYAMEMREMEEEPDYVIPSPDEWLTHVGDEDTEAEDQPTPKRKRVLRAATTAPARTYRSELEDDDEELERIMEEVRLEEEEREAKLAAEQELEDEEWAEEERVVKKKKQRIQPGAEESAIVVANVYLKRK